MRLKIAFPAAVAVAHAFFTSAFAFDARTAKGLLRLDPNMRLEQVCDLAAMERIGKESAEFHPDRAKSDVITPPNHLGNILKADGAAFRSGRKWRRFSFTCRATEDHMKVIAFDYSIGELIPESKWDDYGLWR
ncbi:DUF930 domain-containing protein [Methylocystis heyeri]|uniref:DUF930 domain-containing protein n=1 Tax=Methylocystis heyeri TaxID=391905 RepID=A0A6B8KF60_9HYPH|nr:DUF930 domain-containing protein [Methylocystis heyeri]QGM45103.1 DUF930 domain-containing protein [Methylocystis heyeri]